MKTQSKAIKKMLREWCSVAYKRELDAELSKLHEQFNQWKNGALSPFDLSEAIHEFHQGPVRQLYIRYVTRPSGMEGLLVAAAIRDGFLRKEELPSDLIEALPPLENIRDLEVESE